MEERISEHVDWGRAPADTPVCPEKDILLRDVVQAVLDGFDTEEGVMQELGMTENDSGVNDLTEILDIFVPVINMWRTGGGCGGNCAGCGGSCGG